MISASGLVAYAEHVGASLDRDGSECLEPMSVSIGLHHDAEFRRRDEPPQILNVIEKALARDEHLNVILSHRYLL